MCCDIVSQFILVEMTALNYGFAFSHNGERNGKSVLLALFSALVRRLPPEFSAREPPYEDKKPEIIWALEHQVKRKCRQSLLVDREYAELQAKVLEERRKWQEEQDKQETTAG